MPYQYDFLDIARFYIQSNFSKASLDIITTKLYWVSKEAIVDREQY